MAYNFDKQTCDRCGVSKKDVRPFPQEGWNQQHYAKSFKLGHNGEVWCQWCRKELDLEQLFALMDARDRKGKASK